MEPQIKTLKEKKLIGMSIEMSLVENKTFQLFSTFMPRKKEIIDPVNKDVLDVRVYPKDFYSNFHPSNNFTKWAAVEVADLEDLPKEMKVLELEGGEYAVFTQKGPNLDNSIYQYIFTKWLPHSDYALEDRPHFDVLGEKNQQKSPDAEHEIWIPIKLKG